MIVIACDKFKGSLTSREAAEAIAAGFREGGCRSDILIFEMSDGGEGFPDEIAGYPALAVSDYVGCANKSLCRLPLRERSSYCLGDHINRNFSRSLNHYNRLWIGIGGTMMADGGAGMLQALGAQFYNQYGNLITTPIRPVDITNVLKVDTSGIDFGHWQKLLYVLSDVKAGLFDGGLSALDFIKQKGAEDGEYDFFRGVFKHLSALCAPGRSSDIDGAGGGIGFALATVLGCSYSQGASAILSQHDIDWENVELVVTGEGCIDNQTLGGKVVDCLGEEALGRGIPFVAFGGFVPESMRIVTKQHSIVSTIAQVNEYDVELAAVRLEEAARNYARLNIFS